MQWPCNIIDISSYPEDFTFPGNPAFAISGPYNAVQGKNPEYVYKFTGSTQSGTHIQGAHYFLETGKKIDEYPLHYFEGKACIFRTKKRGEDISLEDLQKQFMSVNIEEYIFLIHSGHMAELIQGLKLDSATRPGLSLQAARYLAETKKVKMIGIDSVGLESRKTENYEVNKYLCEQDVLILEGLNHLEKIRSKSLWLEAFPLKIKGVEGTPCRAIIKEYCSARVKDTRELSHL